MGELNSDKIKSRERYNESSSFSNNLMKRQSFRASLERGGGGGNGIQTRIKSRERFNGTMKMNESSSFSINLMKSESFRASRGRRELNSDKDTIKRFVFFL